MKIIEINKEGPSVVCDNGLTYPIIEGSENLSIDCMQKWLDDSNRIVNEIMSEIERYNG